MPAAASPDSAPAEPVAADGAQTLLDRQIAMLAELAELAMDVARAVGRQAAQSHSVESQAETPGPDLTLAFSRAARAVRLTLLLQTRLTEGPAGAREPLQQPVSREARRARAQAHIERMIREEHGDHSETAERLIAEGAERLDREEAFDSLPMGQIVALICTDLRLDHGRVMQARDLFDEDDERLPPRAAVVPDMQLNGLPPQPPPDAGEPDYWRRRRLGLWRPWREAGHIADGAPSG